MLRPIRVRKCIGMRAGHLSLLLRLVLRLAGES